MKTILISTFSLFAAALMLAVAVPATKNKNGLVKITKERIPMDKRLLRLCIGPYAVIGPHVAAEVDIYVNEIVLDYRRKNPEKFSYPVGSVFVKKKYPRISAKDPDISTMMVRKENKGTVADWEFSMESLPDNKPIRPTGPVSCSSCHERYEERGYISRDSEKALRQHLGLEQ